VKNRLSSHMQQSRKAGCLPLILILLILLCCAGCGQRPAPAPSPADSGGSSAASSPEPSAADRHPREAVTRLTAFSSTAVPTAASLGDGLALTCWTEFADVEDTGTTHLDVIDLEEDQVVRSASLEGYLALVRCFDDGGALLIDYAQACFYLLDESLRPSRIEVPNIEGQFSADHSRYYFVREECLYALNPATGAEKQLTLPDGIRPIRIDAIHPTSDYLTCWAYTSLYTGQPCYAVIDPQQGELLLLQDGIRPPSFQEDQFQSLLYDYDSGCQQLTWGALRGDAPLQSYLLDGPGGPSADVQLISGCGYALQITSPEWDYDSNTMLHNGTADLLRLGGNGLECCPLSDYGLEGDLSQPIYIPEMESILASSYSYEEERCALYLISPAQLSFTDAGATPAAAPERIDQQRLSLGLAELEAPELPPELAEVEQTAQDLEQRYDVHILLSSACAAPCGASDYDVTTTDQAGLEDEALTIAQALGEVEQALSQYPEGFFRQFRSDDENSGIYLMLTGSIDSDDNIFVTAFEFGLGMREYIGLDITLFNLAGNLYHEIWHATENKIFRTDFQGFYDSNWDALNPEGFSYRAEYDLSGGQEALWKWTYVGGDPEVYFVDDYSKTYAKEDRARIMEYVMDNDGLAQAVLAHPVLRQKLEIMDQGIRYAFDTTGWDEVRWMRFA